MDYIKVKDKDNLLRDINSNGVVNDDIEGYQQYIESYKRIKSSNLKINELENNMKDIKNDIDEIKFLLKKLTNGS